MAVFFVSRHPGAVEWATNNIKKIDVLSDHLDTKDVKEGDSVIGNLPMAMAAEICSKGARFFAISIQVRKDERGQELSSQKLEEYDCKIEEFRVMRI